MSKEDIEHLDMEKLFEQDEIAGLMPSVLCLEALHLTSRLYSFWNFILCIL